MNTRVAAARIIALVLRRQGSLSSHLPAYLPKVPEQDRALLQDLCFGTLRWQPRIQACLSLLLDKPLRAKDSDITALLLLGIYQLEFTRIPDHAAIGETVSGARPLKKPWATKLVNGVLRRFQREKDTLYQQLSNNSEFQTAHPQWLLKALTQAWPSHIDDIVAANNAHPPFTLRLNTRITTRDDYIKILNKQGIDAVAAPFSDCGFSLHKPCDPTTLPEFNAGLVSVQDEAAQLAAPLLALSPGLRLLDACSAPGGKTGHCLQFEPKLAHVIALDNDERRLAKVRENLARLKVVAELITGDATTPKDWWDGTLFDRILLDAPCSASGIIRRHSDIKVLRTSADIDKLAQLQGKLLDALWPTLAPNGILLYATCSALPQENTDVIAAFISRTENAHCEVIKAAWGFAQPYGRQLLPNKESHDGFYYAKLCKT